MTAKAALADDPEDQIGKFGLKMGRSLMLMLANT